MGRTLTASSKQAREPIPAGSYKAVVVGVAHVGTQVSQFGSREQIIITWECHKKGQVVGQISSFYGFSFHTKSTLRQDVEKMTGRTFADGDPFDPEALLDFSCRLSVVHEPRTGGGVRDKVGSLMPLDEDDAPVKAEGDGWYYECPAGPPGFSIPDDVPEWIRGIVQRSQEYTGLSEPVRGTDPDLPPVSSRNGDEDSDKPPF